MLSNIWILAHFLNIEIAPSAFKHWYSGGILSNIGILGLLLYTLGFWPYHFKHWISDLILANTGIVILFFQTLELWRYSHKHCLKVWSYPHKHWNSAPILINSGILILSFQTFKSDLILTNFGIVDFIVTLGWIVAPFFRTLVLWSYPYKYWNSDLIVPNIGILALFL